VQPLACTLAAYAELKRLPEPFLKELGLSDISYQGAPALRIPYRDLGGTEPAVRFRTALLKSEAGDNRFRWKSGSKPLLYGLWRLRPEPSVVIVEGESDCHTLWYHGINAVGLPGASLWNESRDAHHVASFEIIYVLVEPDQGGDAMVRWIGKSSLRDRIRLVHLDGFKDPSEMHLADPVLFRDRWHAAATAAVSWNEEAARQQSAECDEARKACRELASTPDILTRFAADLERAGAVGVEREGKLLLLAGTSRLLDRPISIAVKGTSSIGKSFLVEKVLTFFPAEAFHALTAMSERALAYGDEPLKHRMLVLYEAEGMSGEIASYLIRSLLSEGCVRYETVEKTPQGLQGRLIEREGPTGLIVTTTRDGLHPENETRLISLTLADGQEQTRAILAALADEDRRDEVDRAPWHALQRWIAASGARAVVPFAPALVSLIPPIAVRLRRDTKLLLNLIRAHALLHQATRERQNGRVLATLGITPPSTSWCRTTWPKGCRRLCPESVCETVEAVSRIAQTASAATVQEVARSLGIDKSAASRRCKTAESPRVHSQSRNVPGRPARYVVGDPLPAQQSVLPHPDVLASALKGGAGADESGCTVAVEAEGYAPSPLPQARSSPRALSDGGWCCECGRPASGSQQTRCDARGAWPGSRRGRAGRRLERRDRGDTQGGQDRTPGAALLRSGQAGLGAADWRAYLDERAAIREHNGRLSQAEAERLAFEDAVTHWLCLHPAPATTRAAAASSAAGAIRPATYSCRCSLLRVTSGCTICAGKAWSSSRRQAAGETLRHARTGAGGLVSRTAQPTSDEEVGMTARSKQGRCSEQAGTGTGYELTRFNAFAAWGSVPLHRAALGERERIPGSPARLADEHQPKGPTEEHLVEELAGVLWRKRRLRLAELLPTGAGCPPLASPIAGTAKAAVAHLSHSVSQNEVDVADAIPRHP
jgi:hypothetical protein